MAVTHPFGSLPVVDVAPLRSASLAGASLAGPRPAGPAEVARQIEATGGWYRSTPHRVRNASGRDRLSFPLFLDPAFTAEIPPLPGRASVTEGGRPRWDGQNLHAFTGTYGDYLLSKVSKVFPQLRQEVLTDEAP